MKKLKHRGDILFVIIFFEMVMMMDWTHTDYMKTIGIILLKCAYHTYDYVTTISMLIMIVCYVLGAQWLLRWDWKKDNCKAMIVGFVGMSATLCAVDHWIYREIHEHNLLGYRGLGNYLMLGYFGLIMGLAFMPKINEWFEKSGLKKMLSLSED